MRGRPAAFVLLLLLLLGCQGFGVQSEELAQRRFALQWFDAETQRRRTELAGNAEQSQQKSAQVIAPNIEEFGKYLGEVLGVAGSKAEEGSLHQQLAKRFPGRLALVDPVTGDVRTLPATPGALPRDWSADGQKLLYSQLAGRFRQLFVFDLPSETVQAVTSGPLVHPDGCFGPDGRLVLVTAGVKNRSPFSRLEVTEPGGGRPRPFSEGPSDFEVACAPDGSAIAWVSVDERGRDQLMARMPALDGPVRRLGAGRFPAFSPDSEWIVYSRVDRAGRWALQRIRADGSGRRPLGSGTQHAIQPSFSPDGRLIVYVSDDGFEERIKVRRFDGSGDRILLGSGGGTDPLW